MSKQLVLMDCDGGIDDYLSTILLMTMEYIQPLGVIVTPADCYIQPAVSATRKILDLMGCSSIPVAESTVRGINPFPRLYRRDSFIVDHLPILNERETISTPLVEEPGQNFMARVLQQAPEPVTLLVTGPMTTVELAERLHLSVSAIDAAMVRLESQGQVLQGQFRPHAALRTQSSALSTFIF